MTIDAEKLKAYIYDTAETFDTEDGKVDSIDVNYIIEEIDSGRLNSEPAGGDGLRHVFLPPIPVTIKPEKNKNVLLLMVEAGEVCRAERGYYTGTAGIFSVKFPVTHWTELLFALPPQPKAGDDCAR